MLIPGLISVTFRKRSPAEIIALVRQANLRAIEWGGDVHVPHGDLRRSSEVRRQTQDSGLVVSAYGSYYRVGQSEQEGLSFECVLETAVALAAPTIRVWAGTVGSQQADATYRALIIEESRRIGDMAAAADISVSYEFHGGTLTDTNESGCRLLREVCHPNVYTFWQPPNSEQLTYCLAGLQALLPRLTHVHVFHWWPTASDRRTLAEGRDRWAQYLRTIRTTGRDHFASLEFVRDDSPDAFLEDAQTLRHWLASE
jgi:sugar phosphate isomerase/epimerase